MPRSRRYIDPRWTPVDVGRPEWQTQERMFEDEFRAMNDDEKCRVSWCRFVAVQTVEGWKVCHWHGHMLARTVPMSVRVNESDR